MDGAIYACLFNQWTEALFWRKATTTEQQQQQQQIHSVSFIPFSIMKVAKGTDFFLDENVTKKHTVFKIGVEVSKGFFFFMNTLKSIEVSSLSPLLLQ